MIKRGLVLGLLVLLTFGLVGCLPGAKEGVKSASAPFTATKIDMDKYTQIADNVVVLLDASMSMRGKNFTTAKELAFRLGKTIPEEINLLAGFVSIGHQHNVSGDNVVVGALSKFNQGDLASFLTGLKYAGGETPLKAGLSSIGAVVEGLSGRTNVIIISDGNKSLMDGNPIPVVQNYGDRVCVYTLYVGDDQEGAVLMSELADAAVCGFMVDAEDLLDSKNLAKFVIVAFLDEKLAPMAVKALSVSDMYTVYFKFDKTDLTPQSIATLNKAVNDLSVDRAVKIAISITGHTDSRGPESYNQGLSERRVEVVKNYLVDKGISAKRLKVYGYGESMPAASNETRGGRALNRRVDIIPLR